MIGKCFPVSNNDLGEVNAIADGQALSIVAGPCRYFLLFPVLLFYFSCVCCSSLKLAGPLSLAERDKVTPIGSLL